MSANSLTGNIGRSYSQAIHAVEAHATKLTALLAKPVPPLANAGTDKRKIQQYLNELHDGLDTVKSYVEMLGAVVAMDCPAATQGGRRSRSRTRRTRRHK